jgi:alpha-mannosidase
LNYKLIALPFGKHEGTLPAEHSFLQVKSDNVIVSAMKKAEDGEALILRFYEWAGKQGNVTFHLPPGAQSARETNLMEKPIGDLVVTNSELTVPTKPYEIKTVEIKFAGTPAVAESTQQ